LRATAADFRGGWSSDMLAESSIADDRQIDIQG
jgi:hypothetical protein